MVQSGYHDFGHLQENLKIHCPLIALAHCFTPSPVKIALIICKSYFSILELQCICVLISIDIGLFWNTFLNRSFN